jgi:predicted dehydrogenase
MIESNGNASIRIGVVGLGFAGETAIRGFQNVPGAEVVALAGLEEDRLASLGETYGIPHRYHSYEELVAHEGLDAISIGVPNMLHAPVALAALERGLHVLCEKPLAGTLEDAERMVRAARRVNRVLQVVFNHRERADIQLLKQSIDDGELGEIYYAKASWMRRAGIPGVGSWFVNKQLAGGGPLIDLGVHVLDLALYLMGEPSALTVSASTYQELGSRGIGFNRHAQKHGSEHLYEVEDLASAFMRLSNGATLLLEASWATHSSAQDDYGIILYGTRGGAEIRVRNYTTENTLTIYTERAGTPVDLHPHTRGGEFHAAVTRQFIKQIQSGAWSGMDGSEGLRRARIIEACYTSAARKQEIVLEEKEAEL